MSYHPPYTGRTPATSASGEKPPPFPEQQPEVREDASVATAAEARERERMKTKTESKKEQAGLALANLGERAKLPALDKDTPRLITDLKLSESAEKQQRGFDALCDASAILLSHILYSNPNIETELEIQNFENIPLLRKAVSELNLEGPKKSTLQATFNKVLTLCDHPSDKLSIDFQKEWPRLINLAKTLKQEIPHIANIQSREDLKDSEEWSAGKWIHDNPKKAAALAIGGAIGLGFAVYGLYKLFSKSDEKIQSTPQKDEESSAWKWLKWGALGGLTAFAVGSILGWDRTLDWLKKMGVGAKEAWNYCFGEDEELEKHKAMYERMAQEIGSEMGYPINSDFLMDIYDKKYNDIKEEDSWWNKYLLAPVLETDMMNSIAEFTGITFTNEKRNQYKAIRSYLNGQERKDMIAKMHVDDDTTLGQVLLQLDTLSTPAVAVVAGAATTAAATEAGGQKAKETLPEDIDTQLLPLLEENYGKISAEEYHKIAEAKYGDLMAWQGHGSLIQTAKLRLKEVGAEFGVTSSPTQQEQRLIHAKDVVRRFLENNKSAVKSIPADATVGFVIAKILASGNELKKTESLVEKTDIKNDDVAGIEALDEAVKRLPAQKQRAYIVQRKFIVNLVKDNRYIKPDNAEKLEATATQIYNKLNQKALEQPEGKDRAQYRKFAASIDMAQKRLARQMGEREEKWNAYQSLISDPVSPLAQWDKAFDDFNKANEETLKTYATLEGILAQEHEGRSLYILAGLQTPRILYVYLSQPVKYRAFLRQYYGVCGLPTAIAVDMARRLSGPKKGLDLVSQRVEKGERRLTGELGGGDRNGTGNLESRAQLSATESGLNDSEKQARNRYHAEKKILEHDKNMLKIETELDVLRQEQSALKVSASGDPSRLRMVEQEIAGKTAVIKQMGRGRIPLVRDAIEEAADDLHGRMHELSSVNADRALTREQWMEIDDLARRGSDHNRELMRAGEDILEEIRVAARRGASPQEIAALQDSFNKIVGGIPKVQKNIIQKLADLVEMRMGRFGGKIVAGAIRAPGNAYDILMQRGAIRGARKGLDSAEKKHFRKVLATILHWQGSKKTVQETTPLWRAVKGKLVFYGLTLGAIPAAVGLLTKDEKTDYLHATGQAAVDMAPITGTLSDLYTVLYGREVVTDRKVTGSERWLMRPLFGLAGAASDALLVAGIGASLRGELSALRGGSEAARVSRLRGAIDLAAEEAVKAGKITKGATGQAQDAGTIMNFLRTIDQHKAIATVSLVALGIGVPLALNVVKTDEMEIPESLQEIAS